MWDDLALNRYAPDKFWGILYREKQLPTCSAEADATAFEEDAWSGSTSANLPSIFTF